MHYARSFYYNLFNYGLKLSSREIKESIISILIIAFILSFKEWGDQTFNFVTGITNFALAILFSIIAMAVNQFGQRIIAVYYGYDPEYYGNTIGLMISIVIAFASRGSIILFVPGYIAINHLAASRLGEFRYYTNQWEWAKSSFGAPLFNFLFIVILGFLPFREIILLRKLLMTNLWFAVFSLLPLPNNPGIYMFFGMRWFWAFAVGFTVGGCLLVLFTKPLIGLIGALLLGTAAITWYFIKVDSLPEVS